MPIRVQLPDTKVFGQLPMVLIRSSLPCVAKLLYAVLWSYSYRENEESELNQVAKECGCSYSTVMKNLRTLENEGWVETRPSRNHASVYHLLELPDPLLGYHQAAKHLERKAKRTTTGRQETETAMRVATAGRLQATTGRQLAATAKQELATARRKLTTARQQTASGMRLVEAAKRELSSGSRQSPGSTYTDLNRDGDKDGIPSPPPFATLSESQNLAPGRPSDGSKGVRTGQRGQEPLQWASWPRYVALVTGRPWAWTPEQLAAAHKLTQQIPPQALHGWMRNLVRDDYFLKRRDLTKHAGDVNKFMPDLRTRRKLRQVELPTPAAPALTAAEKVATEVVAQTGADMVESYRRMKAGTEGPGAIAGAKAAAAAQGVA